MCALADPQSTSDLPMQLSFNGVLSSEICVSVSACEAMPTLHGSMHVHFRPSRAPQNGTLAPASKVGKSPLSGNVGALAASRFRAEKKESDSRILGTGKCSEGAPGLCAEKSSGHWRPSSRAELKISQAQKCTQGVRTAQWPEVNKSWSEDPGSGTCGGSGGKCPFAKAGAKI